MWVARIVYIMLYLVQIEYTLLSLIFMRNRILGLMMHIILMLNST